MDDGVAHSQEAVKSFELCGGVLRPCGIQNLSLSQSRESPNAKLLIVKAEQKCQNV